MAASPPASPERDRTRDAMPLLRLRLLSARGAAGGGLHALSLDVGRGEFMALAGPEDGGRRLLLAVLAGFARADSGEMLLAGRPIGRTPAHRRGVALVEATTPLLPHLSLARNLGLPLALRGAARTVREEMVAGLLERLGLAGLAGALPAALDAAQRRRAVLARALAGEPRLLLLDDVLAGLPAAAREALLLDLRGMREALPTVLMSCAEPAEALLLADRVAVLAGGRLQQVDAPAVLYDEPANAVAAQSGGPANLLGGTYVRAEDDLAEIHLDCGIAVQARPVDAVRGQRCLVMVRPERVALAAVSAEEMGDGALPAVVEDVLAQGGQTRLVLRVGAPGATNTRLVVQRPAGAPMSGLEIGRKAAVAWQPYHARAFRG